MVIPSSLMFSIPQHPHLWGERRACKGCERVGKYFASVYQLAKLIQPVCQSQKLIVSEKSCMGRRRFTKAGTDSGYEHISWVFAELDSDYSDFYCLTVLPPRTMRYAVLCSDYKMLLHGFNLT